MPNRHDLFKRGAEFERVALPHARGLLRFARRLTGDSTSAEDLVQEALLRGWRSFHQFAAETNARAWLFRILVNVHNEQWRRAKRSLHAVPVATMFRSPDALEVGQAVDRLPSEQRAVIMLAVVEGFTCREAAEILGIPIGTVMSRLSRARQALREKLSVQQEAAGR